MGTWYDANNFVSELCIICVIDNQDKLCAGSNYERREK